MALKSIICYFTEHNPPRPTDGRYPYLRHKLPDVTISIKTRVHKKNTSFWTLASMLSVAAHGVSIEPRLQPLSGERLKHRTAIREDAARLDIAVSRMWGTGSRRSVCASSV